MMWRTYHRSLIRGQQTRQSQNRRMRMYQNLSSKYETAPTQPFTFIEALVRLPLQYIKVLIRPSVNTFSEEMGKASWGTVMVQFIVLVLATVALGVLAHGIPSSTLHTISAFNVGR